MEGKQSAGALCSFRVAVGTRRAECVEQEAGSQSRWNGETTNRRGPPTRYTCVHSFSRVWRNKGRSSSPPESFVRSFSSPQRGRPVANQRRVATVHRPTADYRFSASRYRIAAGEVHRGWTTPYLFSPSQPRQRKA